MAAQRSGGSGGGVGKAAQGEHVIKAREGGSLGGRHGGGTM